MTLDYACDRLDYVNCGDLVYIFKRGDKSDFISCLEMEIMEVKGNLSFPPFVLIITKVAKERWRTWGSYTKNPKHIYWKI